MSKKSVLVTGGTGFIGRRVIQRLLDEGHRVVSMSLPGEAGEDSWEDRVEVRHGNILNTTDVQTALRDCGLIIHLAGMVGQGGAYEEQWEIFVEGTRNICDAAAATGARIVVSTSIAAYGQFVQSHVCHEGVGHGPWAGAYGRAKQGQEDIALSICARHFLDLTIIRPANVYGLGGGGAWGDKLLDSIRGSGGALIGDADRNNAGLVHVDNLADAIVLAGTHPAAIGRTYNVCDEEAITWAEFMTDMAGLVGCPRPPSFPLEQVLELIKQNEDPAWMIGPKDPNLPFMEGVNLVGFDNRIPAGRIRRELGWQPKISYRDAMSAWTKTMALS